MNDNTIELFGDDWTQKLAPNCLSEHCQFVVIEHSNKEAVAFFATVSALTMLDYNKYIIKNDELISRIQNKYKSETPYLICLNNQKDWITSVINGTADEKCIVCTIEEIIEGKV
jgi:hypothetical protein